MANFITDTNLQPVNDTWHAPIDDVVYHGMDWLCPGYSEVRVRVCVPTGALTGAAAATVAWSWAPPPYPDLIRSDLIRANRTRF